jgi:hypothetical protein
LSDFVLYSCRDLSYSLAAPSARCYEPNDL